jgi:hypothetical protein
VGVVSREWKPGDVATIGTRPLLYIGGERWADSFGYQLPLNAEEPRPLVVIDPEDREAVERLTNALKLYRLKNLECAADNQEVIDTQAALREYANPKPPRPDEPQGLGAVVEDGSGFTYTRFSHTEAHNAGDWINEDGLRVQWSSIAAVRVLSPGVEVDQ